MKSFLNFVKHKVFFTLSFERRLGLTVIGLFVVVFAVAMGGIKISNARLALIFDEIESRNILAAKKTLEHDLQSWETSLKLIANSAPVSDWYEYKKFGLSREERRSSSHLRVFFEEAGRNQPGLIRLSLAAKPCEKKYEISKEKNLINICVNHPRHPISVFAETQLSKAEAHVHQFIPNGGIVNSSASTDNIFSLENVPGIFLTVKKSGQIKSLIQSFSMILPVALGTLLLCIFAVLFFLWSKLLLAQKNVLNYISQILIGKLKNIEAPKNLGFSDLESTMKGVLDNVIIFEQSQKETELLNLSKQIAHDIRSPLTALNMLSGSLTELPEEKRILVRNSINRINDIANSLLDRGKKSSVALNSNSQNASELNDQENETIMVSSMLDGIISEKRIQFREMKDVQIELKIEKAYGLFVNAINRDLKRVISNLINNSVEAFKNAKGDLTVSASCVNQNIVLELEDNGIGIPKNILNKLGEYGFSFGKSNAQHSGSGLGIFHAKQTILSIGGTFNIESIPDKGTKIIIQLPRAEAPKWFVECLNLTPGQTLVICDDDTSIHHIWNGRIKSLFLETKTKIKILSFSSGQAFKLWIKENAASNFTCLVDFELLNQAQTGLDIIEELGIQNQAILVTSRYEETHIKSRCCNLGIKLIPKDVAGFMPVNLIIPSEAENINAVLEQPFGSFSIKKNVNVENIADERTLFDLCLIDDDIQMIHTVWSMVAESKGLKIKMFPTPKSFLEAVESIDRRTPIYVDESLGDGIKGTDLAKEIHELGFNEINLATGYSPDSIKLPSFIRRIVGKDFPDL